MGTKDGNRSGTAGRVMGGKEGDRHPFSPTAYTTVATFLFILPNPLIEWFVKAGSTVRRVLR